MFLKIAETQLKFYKEEIASLIYKGDNIAEFCATPIMCEFEITNEEKQKLQKMINEVEKITKTLKQVKNILETD